MNIIWLTIALLLSQPPLLDDFGDPLPPGAIKRLGSIRWRHAGPASGEMFFSGDGKILYSGGGYDCSIRAWDVATGRERFRFKTPEPERLIEFAISKDGKYLACHGYIPPQNDDGRIPKNYTHLFDATTGEHLSAWEERSQAQIALSSNGSLIATCLYREQGGEVILVRNTKTGAIQCEWHEEKGGTLLIRFIQDDQRLLVVRYSQSKEPMSLFILDARQGKTLTKRVLERMPGISYFAISPDDQRLVYLDKDADQIRMEELLTGKLLKSFPKDKLDIEHTHLEFTVGLKAPEKDDIGLGFQFSTNGQLLSIVYGRYGDTRLSPLRLQIFETASLQKKQEWKITQRWLGYTAFSPDNRIVAVNGTSNAIRLYDIASGQPLNDVEQNPPADPRDCCFSPDGKLLAFVGHDRYIDLWDTATWHRHLRWPTSHGLTSCSAFSPDGTKLLTGSYGNEAAIWETSTGKQLHKLLHPQLVWITHGAWVDHGKKVVFTGVGPLHVFDAESSALHAIYQHTGGYTCDFSRNGTLIVYQREHLCLASTSTGAMLDQLPEAKNLQALRLAPHQQTIAANHQDRTLKIWELSTHGVRWQAKTMAMNNSPMVLAFSNDGRWIASGHGWQSSPEPNEITIYNADTGALRCRFPGQPALHKMVFSPNDHQLVSVAGDGTGLVWALPPLPAPAPWSKDEADRNWDLLAHQDAAQAAPAVARFLETPPETIAFFQAKLAPIPAIPPPIIRDWISQLDSGKFADREKAFQELAKLGGLAEPVLQEAKTKTLGAEGQRRVIMLLQQIQNKELTAAERQALRAAEITARINGPAARQLLQAWSRGASSARLTKKASELIAN